MSASARGRGRESHIYRFICHSPLALRPRHSCCVCWHFMWFAQQLQRDKTKQLPCSVLFARLLLRLLISVNRERSFVRPSSLGASANSRETCLRLCAFYWHSLPNASLCGSHPEEKVLNWQKVKTPNGNCEKFSVEFCWKAENHLTSPR